MQKFLTTWRTLALMLVLVANIVISSGQPRSSRTTAYAAGSTDNVALRTISGARTGLSNPLGVAVDSAGHLYVANILGSSITMYAPGANGDAAPLRTVSGSRAGLSRPGGVALDSRGTLYVSNIKNNSITVYAAQHP